MTGHPIRQVALDKAEADVEVAADGTMVVRHCRPLGPYGARLTDRLDHWAAASPDRIWLAARGMDGEWQRIDYASARRRVRAIAAGLLGQRVSAERPIAILSGNSIAHGLLATAALYAGIPYAPIAPAYSTVATDFTKLRSVLELLTPGLVFIEDAAPFVRAIADVVPRDCLLIVERNPPPDRPSITLEALAASADRRASAAVDNARDAIRPDHVAKILFTSGSTGVPKGVINTHRMLCANVEQITWQFSFFRDEPPVTVDWAPWNHTAGSNHDFNLVLHNGGTLYIDEGKPTPSGIAATVRNLRDIAPNWYFNVPKGYAALLPFLRADEAFRRHFFSRLKVIWYAGAGMARYIWNELDELARAAVGERIAILSGYGATETGPFVMAGDLTMLDAGLVGLPTRGCELKLVPTGGKLEVRVKGPNITPGYWRDPERTRAAFDEEGYYLLGDALRFSVPGDASRGFYFDGRIAEDFKLSTGTWVAVGPLRTHMIEHFAPYVQDVVLAGLDRDYVAALVFLDVDHCRELAGRPKASLAELAEDMAVRKLFAERLEAFAAAATGSSLRVERVVIVPDPPSIDSAEMTDKGSLNQRAVLANRAHIVDELFAEEPSPRVMCAKPA